MDSSHHESFGWAVLGPGRIARRFADAVNRLPGMHLAAVHGRDLERARTFAAQWSGAGSPGAAASADLAQVLQRPDVDGVYIATPHAFHADAIRGALMAGKAVLCEKPLVTSTAQALPLMALSRERGVLLMEALWTRLLPLYDQLGGWLRGADASAIGRLRGVQSSFCFPNVFDPGSRLFDPAQAGGALLDVGVYNLAVTRWVLQQALGDCPEPKSIRAVGTLAPTGVDQRVWGMLDFGGVVSQFSCGIDGTADNGLRILGEHGHITVPSDFWQATEAWLHRPGREAAHLDAPWAINGFEGEVVEAVRCARSGLAESPAVTHADTLAVLRWMDEIRSQLGVRYPFD